MVSDIFNITMDFINKWAINKNDVFINGIYFQTNMLFEQPKLFHLPVWSQMIFPHLGCFEF